jgi:UTRA domain
LKADEDLLPGNPRQNCCEDSPAQTAESAIVEKQACAMWVGFLGRLSKVDWADPISDNLQKKLGIQMGDALQSIRASLADVETSRILGIRVGVPLLSVARVVYSKDGMPVDRVLAHSRSDIISFTVHLRKGHSLGDSAPERVSQNAKRASRTGWSKRVTSAHRTN